MNIQDFLSKYRTPLFAPDDEQGAGDGGTQGGDQAPADKHGTDTTDTTPQYESKGLLGRARQDGGEGEQAQAEGATDRPDNIPEKFWKDGAVNTDAMAKAYADLEKAHGELKRSKQNTGEDVPEAASDYFKEGLELGEDVSRLSIQGPDDPGLKAWGEVCHKYGIGKELATNLAKDMFGMMDKHAPEPINPDAEYDKLGRNADAILEGVDVWARGMHEAGRLSEEDMSVLDGLSSTAKGIQFLSSMRSMMGEKPIPVTDATTGAQMTIDKWDSQFKAAVGAKDYAEQERLEKLADDLDLFGAGVPAGRVNYDRPLRAK